jgi:transcriptional regulator with XRE-family HTH domain
VPDPNRLLLGLGLAIRSAREEQNISQEELGLRSGVHRNYIGGVERAEREPTVRTIARLAESLNIKPSELIARGERFAP